MLKLLIILFSTASLFSMEKEKQLSKILAFNKEVVRSRESFGELELFKKDNDFYVQKNGISKLVKSYDVDPLLKKATKKQLKKYLQQDGYIQVDQLNNLDYVLKAKGRIKGGGPICAWFAYGATKATLIGTAVAGAGAAVVATGGTAGAVTGAIAGAATLPASAGAAVVGSAIAGAGLATEAGVATVAVVNAAGGIAAAGAAVETASLFVAALFAGPWCP